MDKYSELKIKLEIKRDELQERLDRVLLSKRKEHDRDLEEQATERENDEVVDMLGENIIEELRQINHSLLRMENNEYNVCSSCKENIPDERLFALPYTSLCINCASNI